MNKIQQDRPPNKSRSLRSFPPYSQVLSLAVDWVLSAPAPKRARRLTRAAYRCAELLQKKPFTIAAWLWSMVGFDTLKKLSGGAQ
jgi:hypothetical protein